VTFFLYCLSVYFVFYVFNCSDIAAQARAWAEARLPSSIVYVLNCALCFTWWITVVAAVFSLVPYTWAFAAPIANLITHKALEKLS
jgi:hypothetical protein